MKSGIQAKFWSGLQYTSLVLGFLSFSNVALARPVPDETLSEESSRVVDRSERDFDIDGGARRGRNLFHSFRDFGVEDGGSVYFLNPTGVENIFSRVTGANRSDILGTLGVRGDANLFLMNPNGILFGPNASLDVQGSFVGTTANAIGFGEQGFFAASDGVAPGLLTVNPSAFLFNQAGILPRIENQGLLIVPERQHLILLGGDVEINGGGIGAFGGRVEIGAASVGSVVLNQDGSLLFPQKTTRANVLLNNGSAVVTRLDGEGNINITARNIALSGGSTISAGIESRNSSGNGQPGDLTLNASESIQLNQASRLENELGENAIGISGNIEVRARSLTISGQSRLSTIMRGRGDSGRVIIGVDEQVVLDGQSSIVSSVAPNAVGNSGGIELTTGLLRIINGAGLSTLMSGRGSAGDIIIRAHGVTTLEGISPITSSVDAAAVGNAGDIKITTGSLIINNGAGLLSSTFGRGNAGNIIIHASDSVNLEGDGTIATSEVSSGAVGQGGNINIATGTLSLTRGAQLLSKTSGQGDAGNIIIHARDRIFLDGTSTNGRNRSAVFSSVNPGGIGRGGSINIVTDSLSLSDRAQLQASTFGQGNSGNITVNATGHISFATRAIAVSAVQQRGFGQGGNISISTDSLSLTDGSQLTTATVGRGNAGNVSIRATGDVSFDGTSSDRQFSSGVLTVAGQGSIGRGGSIDISANSFSLTGQARLASSTAGQGDAGDITINTRDRTSIENSSAVLTTVQQQGIGEGGDITINTSSLTLSNGGQLTASTLGQGDAGNVNLQIGQLSVQNGASISASTAGSSGQAGDITVNADSVELGGISTDRSSVSIIGSQSEINPATNTFATGNAGNITVTARTLSLQDGARISTSTTGQGRAGNLLVRATESAELSGTTTIANEVFRSGLTTSTFGSGRAGNLRVEAGDLRLLNGGQIIASTVSSGRAGDIRVEADSILLSGASRGQPRRASGIASNTFSQDENAGDAGNIRIFTGDLSVRDQAVISTATSGQGNAGGIRIQNSGDTVLSNDGNITSSVNPGAVGDGGKITLRTRSLSVDGAQIAAVVSRQFGNSQNTLLPGGRGRGGDISITVTDGITLTGITRNGFSGGILTLSERGADGSAGNITITADDFRIADGAIVVASTFNRGNAGSIEINANNFEAVNGGQVVTNTRDRGRAGSITLNADNVTLSGRDLNFQNRQERVRRYTQPPNTDRVSDVIVNQGSSSGLFANTSGSGRGGEITVDSDNLDLTDRAAISTTSQSRGQAGNIGITATEHLRAEDGTIATSATRSSGGDITLSGGSIRLFDNSDIRTNSRRTGGNITVNADSLVAFDDSDIIASAQRQGGDINFGNTITLFENYSPDSLQEQETGQLEGNSRADLNAAGERSGEISLPDTSFIQNSLSDLPSENLDAEQLIANSCIARRADGSTFLVTGRGSLPQRPGAEQPSEYPTGEVRGVEETESQGWQMRSEVVEPEGVYRLSDGRLVMSRPCQSSQ